MKSAITARRLSKSYRIGADSARSGYRTLRESLMAAFPAPRRRRRADDSRSGEHWAIRDVSFDVQPGEVLGVVGRNGAGKSTLLKMLSRIVSPTAGEIVLRGRVGSLLEVGTGFHPELTGRENIYLNGSILGMTRREIKARFDEIVAFSEVEKFLDTPVKRYSSGMYMKLAFAVASHLEPEILLVDEVLAVGDAQFQKKCLGKMGEVSRHGRTVLFVSHNMTAIKALCSRALLIENGTVAHEGEVDEVVNRYLSAGTNMAKTGIIPTDAIRQQDRPGQAFFRTVRVTDQAGVDRSQFYFGQPFRVGFTCDVVREVADAHFEVSISTADGTQVTYSTTLDGGRPSRTLKPGTHEVWLDLDAVLLPHAYTIDLGLHQDDGTTLDYVQRTLDFGVLRVAQTGSDHYRWPRTRGFVRPAGRWECAGP